MNYKQIETSREIRLWIRDIVVPAIGIGATVLALHPELKTSAKNKYCDVKAKIKNKNLKIVK